MSSIARGLAPPIARALCSRRPPALVRACASGSPPSSSSSASRSPLPRASPAGIVARPSPSVAAARARGRAAASLSPSPSPATRGMAAAAAAAGASGGELTYLTQAQAAALDADLMDPAGPFGFSLEQLMELAGLSVAAAVRDAYPPTSCPRALVVCGPGNNGGDGLVAARHLFHFGYSVTVCLPRPVGRAPFKGLVAQLRSLGVPVWDADELGRRAGAAAGAAPAPSPSPSQEQQAPRPLSAGAPPPPPSLRPLFDVAVDAVFGFSYSGGAPRAPYAAPLALLSPAADPPPLVSVDLPSGWHPDRGDEGGGGGAPPGLRPDVLVSLTAPKLAARAFVGARHYVGGRFVPPAIAERYGLRLPSYAGAEQIALVPAAAPPAAAAAPAAPGPDVPASLNDPPPGPSDAPPAADMRISYTRGELLESGGGGDPMRLFAEWFAAAAAEPSIEEPNAVCLSTGDPQTGAPSARVVLLKSFTPSAPPPPPPRTAATPQPPLGSPAADLPPPPPGGSFVIYTNLQSRKGRELFPGPAAGAPGAGAAAALTFWWPPLQRSVRVEGPASPVAEAEAAAYFASRPRASQIGAWASEQSRPCPGGRAELEAAERAAEARFAGGGVPKPPHWGGVRVRPLRVEFWQGRPSRLHDRLVFERPAVDAPWPDAPPQRLFP